MRASTHSDWRPAARAALRSVRARTEALLRPLSDAVLATQPSPLMSPPVWDLAHVANYEERWLLRTRGEAPRRSAEVDRLYDAFRQPRSVRAQLPLLSPKEAFRYAEEVRERVWETLEYTAPDEGEPLFRDGFVYGMVAQHEAQHAETLCATLQLAEVPLPGARRVSADSASSPRPPPSGEVLIPGGRFPMGSALPWSYDNERPRHPCEVAPFFIDRAPVTNSAFAELIADGGYEDPRLWSAAGWAHKASAGLEAPAGWAREGSGWTVRRFGETIALPLDEPVQHVCVHEAEAFARWAGKRLPTEAEWERAATGAEGEGYPWGDVPPTEALADLGQVGAGPSAVGAHPEGRSREDVWGLIGGVWEWTSTPFSPYPGFEPFPYPEYSEVFFDGAYRVLRGGSWATSPLAVRNSFRNWDFPIRRQIFAGFRCARSADAPARHA